MYTRPLLRCSLDDALVVEQSRDPLVGRQLGRDYIAERITRQHLGHIIGAPTDMAPERSQAPGIRASPQEPLQEPERPAADAVEPPTDDTAPTRVDVHPALEGSSTPCLDAIADRPTPPEPRPTLPRPSDTRPAGQLSAPARPRPSPVSVTPCPAP